MSKQGCVSWPFGFFLEDSRLDSWPPWTYQTIFTLLKLVLSSRISRLKHSWHSRLSNNLCQLKYELYSTAYDHFLSLPFSSFRDDAQCIHHRFALGWKLCFTPKTDMYNANSWNGPYMYDIFDHHHLYSMNWKKVRVFLCLYLCPKHLLKSLIELSNKKFNILKVHLIKKKKEINK